MGTNNCSVCNGTTHIVGSTRPCPHCSDSGTPDLDATVGIRYSAGINREGKLVRPITECLNKDGSVRPRQYAH